MNIFKSIIFFSIIALGPVLSFYLIFDGKTFQVSAFLFLLVWAAVYLHLDKFVLMLLKAREVVDSDHQELFQFVKNQAYKTKNKIPKIYLYSGQALKCFALESRSDWALVIDRKLLLSLDHGQMNSLVAFLFALKDKNVPFIQTKVMGIYLVFFHIIYWILRNIFFLSERGTLFKVLSVFIFGMMRPILYPLEFLATRTKEVNTSDELRAIVNQTKIKQLNYNDFVMAHLISNVSNEELLFRFIESFPIFENTRFVKDEYKEYL